MNGLATGFGLRVAYGVLFAAFACMPHGVAAESSVDWKEEVLLQLSELRKAQGDLRQQVADLQGEVAALRSGTGDGKGVELSLSDASYPTLGASDAPVAIVEFSDFECPFCRRHGQGTLPALVQKYVSTGKVRYYFLDFPLAFHRRAEGAAVAAACAQRQGQFWKMHDALFANQNRLSDILYGQLAGEIGLEATAFTTCLADDKVKAALRDRVALGQRLGVQGTPAFFVGKLKDGMLVDAQSLSGARPAADFERLVEQHLAGS